MLAMCLVGVILSGCRKDDDVQWREMVEPLPTSQNSINGSVAPGKTYRIGQFAAELDGVPMQNLHSGTIKITAMPTSYKQLFVNIGFASDDARIRVALEQVGVAGELGDVTLEPQAFARTGLENGQITRVVADMSGWIKAEWDEKGENVEKFACRIEAATVLNGKPLKITVTEVGEL